MRCARVRQRHVTGTPVRALRVVAVVAAVSVVAAAGCSGLPATPADPADLAMAPTIPVGSGHRPEPPANTIGGFRITLPAMTLQPGQERFPCYALPIEVRGSSRLIGGAVLRDPIGVHHGNVTSRPVGSGPKPPAPPCDSRSGIGEVTDVQAGGVVLFGSSTQVDHDEWERFPDGMAYRLPRDQEAVFRMHYLNASPAPMTIAPTYEWFTVDEQTLTQELAPFAWKYGEFTIPAKSDFSVRAECDFRAPMHVVSVLPHMHRMGRAFTAGFVGGPLDGRNWLVSTGYDPERGVMQLFEPAVDLSQGLGTAYTVSYSCVWRNDLEYDVHEGVGDNEMCVLFGYGYPPGAVFTVLSGDNWCQVLSSGSSKP